MAGLTDEMDASMLGDWPEETMRPELGGGIIGTRDSCRKEKRATRGTGSPSLFKRRHKATSGYFPISFAPGSLAQVYGEVLNDRLSLLA